MAGSSALGQTLRQIADKDGMLIGTAVRSTQLSEPAYATTLAREFNIGGSGRCDEVVGAAAGRATTYDFREGDEVVRFAHAHQMKV